MTDEKPKRERTEKQKAQFAAAQQLAYKKRKEAAEAKKSTGEPPEEGLAHMIPGYRTLENKIR